MISACKGISININSFSIVFFTYQCWLRVCTATNILKPSLPLSFLSRKSTLPVVINCIHSFFLAHTFQFKLNSVLFRRSAIDPVAQSFPVLVNRFSFSEITKIYSTFRKPIFRNTNKETSKYKIQIK